MPDHERGYRIVDYQFPTDSHRQEFLDGVASLPESTVRNLLRRFLFTSGTLGTDRVTRLSVMSHEPAEIARLIGTHEFIRRLVEPPFLPWEGVTWILDLLPHSPSKAIDVLDAFFAAHCQFLPDGRINGLLDAEAIIRHRYLHWDNPREALLSLRPAEFEFLVGALYQKMGYEVVVTQASRDGGVDVEARREDLGGRALVLVQCKRYDSVVGVPSVRELMGVVARRQANKGVLVATCRFTGPARQEASSNAMIELLDYSSLNRLMNQYFGSKWPDHASYEIRRLQMRSTKSLGTKP